MTTNTTKQNNSKADNDNDNDDNDGTVGRDCRHRSQAPHLAVVSEVAEALSVAVADSHPKPILICQLSDTSAGWGTWEIYIKVHT